jgi:Rrf2 family protein
MLKLTRDIEYALISLVAMGEQGERFSRRELAERFNIPQELLSKILQRLAKAGIVTSTQGPTGGYALAGDMDSIAVGDVIQAIQGSTHLVACLDEEACRQAGVCNIHDSMAKMQDLIGSFFQNMSLRQFVELRSGETAPHETVRS